ncbi:MAG TPA: glutathione-independent formaldehyde dehydrogenase [Enteractinococcus helveticum]|uniref:Glutathione-independent formaldehyde dehydrogenase n=1 Tax=Enteractinococcus helveticum TaxID=1837282 RepID=A0A921FRS6_9MICC|nr:glutathione-independent formaldehyde dehydrogenase [Enteractinococcus helveticum]HJF15977.1 glutathione-independent formaldehyde dehydrogenase [Enteractinococcus helveticum]
MKAVVYKGPFEVAVEDVDDPVIQDPTDVIVKITSTAICGSDLHMYEGRTDAKPGITFGHENMGIVEEIGSGVTTVNVGDRVVMPFNVACGFCDNCRAGNSAFCLTVNEPGKAGGAYGYVGMGPYGGGQAEYLRVPFADYNCVQLPQGEEHEKDFALLADIFPTGYHSTELAGVRPGETVAVYGAGPVGLMAAYSAQIKGASRVFVVDNVPNRLELVKELGAEPINFNDGDPAQQISDAIQDYGVDRGIDAVGYQATEPDGHEQPAVVLNQLVDTVRPTGGLGVVGLYVPSDPGAPDEHSAKGELLFRIGRFFEKGQTMGTGQANVKKYAHRLRDLIIAGRAKPGFVVSKELPLADAPDAYERFDKREEGYSKVLLQPARG